MARKDISDLQVVQACVDARGTTVPASTRLEERTGQHPKVVERAMERATDRDLIEYGSSIRWAWATDKGLALLKGAYYIAH